MAIYILTTCLNGARLVLVKLGASQGRKRVIYIITALPNKNNSNDGLGIYILMNLLGVSKRSFITLGVSKGGRST